MVLRVSCGNFVVKYLEVRSLAKWATRKPATIIAIVRNMVSSATSVPRRFTFPDISNEEAVALATPSVDKYAAKARMRYMGFEGIRLEMIDKKISKSWQSCSVTTGSPLNQAAIKSLPWIRE